MLVVLYVNVLWYLYDVTHPRMFPPYPGLGVWQIGIRTIGYSELVNILNKEIQNLQL